jgi:protein phosphatase
LVSLKSWAESDIGRKRANNEDAYFHDRDLGLFMVADGMGGHRGGDKASKIAIKHAAKTYKTKLAEDHNAARALKYAFLHVAREVFDESLRDIRLRGMGTTLSALAILGDRAFIAHIGDSRIYCLRDNNLCQLTSDHSLVNEQIQAGILSEEEARKSSLRNIITRAIGHDDTVQPDCYSLPVHQNDIFLLCTDGLNNMLLDSDICKIISSFKPEEGVKQLILNANLKGGEDNITVILVAVQA